MQSLRAYGQEDSYIFRNINTSAGLASNTVTGILQDNKGFMWIATGNGVQKYDGNSFTTYHHDPYDPQSISSDNAAFLLKDREDNIWILTSFLGFNKFNPSTGKNTRISDFADSSLSKLDYSTSACLDTGGNTWLASFNTIAEYDVSRHQIVSYDYLLPKGNSIGMTKTILCDPRTGDLWINSVTYGVCMLDPKKKVFYTRKCNPEKLPVFDLQDTPGILYLDRENNLWINSYNGNLYRYNLGTHRIRKYFSRDSVSNSGKRMNVFIDCMMQDRKGTIWMGARKNGLLEYFPRTDSFSSVPRNSQTPGGLDYNEYLLCLYEDREGNIWIGSDKGIFIFNPYRQQFRSVNLAAGKNDGLSTAPVANFIQTKNNDIWVAAYRQGIQVFDEDGRYKRTYSYQGNNRGIGEPDNRVWSFLNRPDGKILIGCQHGSLSVYDPVKGTFSHLQPRALDSITIINMVADSEQNTWMALYSGIAKWDHKKGIFTRYPDILRFRANAEGQVSDLVIDNRQNIWVATQSNGLQKFDAISGRFIKMYVPEKGNPISISSRSVQCITKVNDSLFALGTASGGIDLFNCHTGQFSYITTREGLPSNNVTAIYFQAPHDLWVTTVQGICKVNLDNKRVFHYGLEDGIVGNNFGDCLRFYKTKDGSLLMGYQGGFVRFNPDSIGSKEPPANVTITGFKVYNRSLPVDSLLDRPEPVALSFRQNFITITFASLSFLEPQRINYYYQLQGVDKEWVNAGTQRLAAYANLSAGKYTFMVKCENRDGIPSQKTTFLAIVIDPPFWQTAWFRFLLVAAITLFLYGLYRYRINQLLELLAMRNEISQDLHDDLGATLGSISILSEVARDKVESGDQEQTRSLLARISSHSREMVEKMNDIVWAINPKNENLERMIQRLSDFSLETCASKDIRLKFHADDSVLKRGLSMEAKKNIYLIVKEAMNNAIRHSGCHQLTVTFKSVAGSLEIAVADDGTGFDPQSVRNGNGLVNMESRVKEMKGSLTIHSENQNTVVALKIPIT
jgi:ligand-binding sensor domain-containing protein/two-component sensor histidine kinase